MSVYDDPEMAAGGDYFTFTRPGDQISGTVNAVRAHRFTDGTVAPQLLLTTDDGAERTVTCGAIRLKLEILDQRPEAGDHVVIRLDREEPRGGGKTLRHWAVQVVRGTTAQPAVAPYGIGEVPLPASRPDQAAAAEALAALTPAQRAALGLPNF